MADTGPPWNLRFPGPQDFVRETNFYIEDLAEDTATALSAAGGLVAVKHVLKTDTFTESSVAAGGNVAVDDLEIEHALADANNRLIITAYFGAAANSAQTGQVGIAVAEDDGSGPVLIGVGTDVASRTAVGAGGLVTAAGAGEINVVTMPSVTFVHAPNTTDSRTYTVVAINAVGTTRNLFVNRSEPDTDNAGFTRAASALIIQEVKV